MKRRASSEVISAVILSGVVLAIGGFLWSYSLGATSVIASDYVNDTLTIVDEVTERFIIEKTFYDSTNSKLVVWVYNYGNQKTTLDIYIDIIDFTPDPSPKNIVIQAKEHGNVKFDANLVEGDQIIIRVFSRRQNVVQNIYTIP